jgi:hypothetical protein
VTVTGPSGEEDLESRGGSGRWPVPLGEGPEPADERDEPVEAGVDLVARNDGFDRLVVQLPRG